MDTSEATDTASQYKHHNQQQPAATTAATQDREPQQNHIPLKPP